MSAGVGAGFLFLATLMISCLLSRRRVRYAALAITFIILLLSALAMDRLGTPSTSASGFVLVYFAGALVGRRLARWLDNRAS
jgi:uncharacterized membrane protein YfcA